MALVETWLPDPTGARRSSALVATRAAVSTRTAALVACVGTLAAVGWVHAVNLANWPTLGNDDEGTYMARAWAVQTGRGAHHSLANYTYWYDHVPFGWIQLVPWTWLTGAYRAGAVADVAGRRIMVGYTLVATLAVYVIARRLGSSRPVALAATALFGFSPVAVDYTRQIFLDTIGLPWILWSFALATSPRRRVWAFAASGACLAAALLSKETYLLWAPAVLYQAYRHADPRARRLCLAALCSVAGAIVLVYPLYATLKGELVPGPGHVSLIGSIEWQLSQRSGSGSILSASSSARHKLMSWYDADPWLVGGGVVALVPALATRRLRPLAAAIVVPGLYVLRGGYLPAMFVIGFLPFLALAIACGAEALWRLDPLRRLRQVPGRGRLAAALSLRVVWRGTFLAVLAALAGVVAPAWAAADHDAMTFKSNAALFEAERWVERHVARSATVVVDENLWADLVDDGFRRNDVVAFWELGQDPQVAQQHPRGWRQMGYVVVSNTMRVNLLSPHNGLGEVASAIAHSTPLVRFGTGTNFVTVRRVHPKGPASPPWWLPGYGSMRPPTTGPAKGEQL